MPAKRRHDKRRQGLSPEALAWLDGNDDGSFGYLTLEKLAALWREHGEKVTAEHARRFPGSRPSRWWQFSAPEPRRRLSGIGTPCHERLAYDPELYCGVPAHWITPGLVDTYRRIGTDLAVPAINPGDPPMYESEASYLTRMGLLLPGERRRLRAADFERESVTDILGLSEDDEE